MPPAPKTAPATPQVVSVLQDSIRLVRKRLDEKDSHRFADLTKLTEQLFKFTCELSRIESAIKTSNEAEAEIESCKRRISELEFQLGIYKDKYGDIFRASSVDGKASDDSEPFGAWDDSVPSA